MFSADALAKIIGDHEMKAWSRTGNNFVGIIFFQGHICGSIVDGDAVFRVDDALEHFDQVEHAHMQAGFFEKLTRHTLL